MPAVPDSGVIGATAMVELKRIKLDVLKPHHPNALEFATSLAEDSQDCRIDVKVLEMDEKTETLEVVIVGDNIDFDRISARMASLGGSLHSIDEVSVSSSRSDA